MCVCVYMYISIYMYTFELQIHDASGRDTIELLVIDRNIELYGLGLDFQGRYQSCSPKVVEFQF